MAKKSYNNVEWDGAFSALRRSITLIRANGRPVVFFIAVYTLAHLLSMMLQNESVMTAESYVPYADAMMLLFVVPLTMYFLARVRGQELTVQEFMQIEPAQFFRVFGTSLLSGLLIFASILALIVPVIWVAAWLAFAVLIAADKGQSPMESLATSKRLAQNNLKKIWGVIGVSLLVSVCGAVFATIPYVGAAGMALAVVVTGVMSAQLYFALLGKAK